MSTSINRKPIRFYIDPKRVIVRFFFPGPETRVQTIIQKVVEMPEEAAMLSLNQVFTGFFGKAPQYFPYIPKTFRSYTRHHEWQSRGLDHFVGV